MNKFLNFIVGAVLAVSATFAFADDFKLEKIGVHTVSRHFPHHGQNEVNSGLYASFKAFGISGFVLGGYRNSQNEDSFYFGKNFETSLTNRINVGIMLGGVTGYKKTWYETHSETTVEPIRDDRLGTVHYVTLTNHYQVYREKKYDLLPLISPTISIKMYDDAYVRFNIIPAGLKKGHSTAVGLSFEYNFKEF